MLAWINTQIPEQGIKNFTTDWNDGVAICALVDRIQPGLIPHYASLSRSDKLKNCTLGMGLADDKLDIPKILEPEELSHPDVDEISVMTYISYFCSPANYHLLKWVQATIPHCNIKNFTTDWNNGINFACLLEALNPGGFPDCKKLDPRSTIENLTQCMKAAEDQLGIKPILTPSQMADPSVDELNIVTYLSRFQNAKPIPKPSAISCSGDGLRKAIVKREAVFEVDTSKGGYGDLAVEIRSSDKSIDAKISPNFGTPGVYTVKYSPQSSGSISIVIKWSGAEIPSSPYPVNVIDPKAISLTGLQITGNESAKVGQLVKMEAKGVADVADFEVSIQFSNGHTEEAKLVPASKGVVECSYTTRLVGTDKVSAKIAGMVVPGSPFKVKVIDPKLLSVTLRNPPMGKPLLINTKATIVVSAAQGAVEGVTAELIPPQGGHPQDVKLQSESTGSSVAHVTPAVVGTQKIKVSCGGEDIKGSPISLNVVDPSKCVASGPGLASGKGKTKEAFDFTIQTKGAGDGELTINPKGPKSTHPAEITKKSEGTYSVTFTSFEVGNHSIEILWSGHHIHKSPYSVNFIKAAAADKFTATGDGLKTAVALSPAKFMIVGPESGLLADSTLKVALSGNGLKSSTVGKAEFKPESGKALVFATDNKNGSYTVEFAVPKAGKYSLAVTSDTEHIPDSPFQVTVLPAPNAGKCKAFSHAIDNPSGLVMQKPLEFKVDSTEAGTGELSVTAKDPTGSNVPAFLAEDKSSPTKRIHSVKIDPKVKGRHEVIILWSGKPIPKNPFTFDVSDPKLVNILGLADAADFVGRKGEPITFSLDTSKAGSGDLKVAAKLDDGKVEPFQLKKAREGVMQASYTPKKEGKLEILVTFCGVSVLPLPWITDITDPTAFKVNPPKDPGRQNEDIRFTISGMSKKQSKTATLSAKNGSHDAAVKLEFGDKGQTSARFTAKEIGEYTVEVIVAKKHIPGSPFKCLVVNPDNCTIIGSVPTIVPIGTEDQFTIDTKKAGPGDLTIECSNEDDGTPSSCLLNTVTGSNGMKTVKMIGKVCGKSSFAVKFAGYEIPNMPVTIVVTNPSQCTFSCKEVENGFCKTDENITIDVDTTRGGSCTPVVSIRGPKSNYDAKLKKLTGGRYSVNLKPWQDGQNTISVTVGGQDVSGSPRKFESMKPLDINKVTVEGPGLKEAIANRRTQFTIYARESMLVDRGILSVSFLDNPECDLEVHDQQNGTYSVTYTPTTKGTLKVDVKGNGHVIPGSPFNINVMPEPDSSKCKIQNRSGEEVFVDSSTVYHLVKTPFELSVLTTDAGMGTLVAAGEAPNKSQIRVFTHEERVNGDRVSYIKFDPSFIGNYSLSLSWDNKMLKGSPYTVKVIDPTRCKLSTDFPSCVQLSDEVSFEVDVNGAGNGEIEVFSNGAEVEAKVTNQTSGVYTVSLLGAKLGSTSVDVRFGGSSLPGAPYAIVVCDPGKCSCNLTPGICNLNIPLKFSIMAENAGRAKLQVVSSRRGTPVIRNPHGSTWEVSLTPKEIGEYSLQILWGGFEIPGGPFTFTVCDPGMVKVKGVPNPNDVLLMGEPVVFTVDSSEAGSGTVSSHTIINGVKEDLVQEETDSELTGVTSMQFVPKSPGKIQLVVEFNGVDVLFRPHFYDVPDPSQFKVTPPRGYGKVNEVVKFSITGVKEGTELSITAAHPEQEASVTKEQELDSNTVIARINPTHIGDYDVEVEHGGQHIDGSPFIIQVCDPDACRFAGPIPSVVHVGVEPNIVVDPSEAGPGELTFESEILAGATNASTESEDKEKWVLSLTEGVGKIRVTTRWGGYSIPNSPFILTIVDSALVTWSCDKLDDKDSLVQGEFLKIFVDGSEAGETVPEVIAKGPGEEEYAAKIADNEDGTYTVALNPWHVGKNEVTILWGGQPIPDMPITFKVLKSIDSKAITVSGKGLTGAIAREEETIFINAIEAGLLERGVLSVTLKGEEGEDLPTYNVSDEGDGIYKLSFTASKEGKYSLHVIFEDQHVTNSPFDMLVWAAPDSGKCKVFGEAMEKDPPLFISNFPVKFSIDTSEAGCGTLSISATQPDREPVQVYTLEEGDVHHLKFDPVAVGHYEMNVKWGGGAVPGSPFNFNVIDLSKCAVEGIPSQLEVKEEVNFTVQMMDVGDCLPDVTAVVKGKSTELEGSEAPDGFFSYTYSPSSFGKTAIEVKVADIHVPGSPFNISVVDPNTFSITGLNLKGDYAIVCEPVTITIEGTGDEKILVTAHGPSADLSVDTKQTDEAVHEASFVPIEPGSYEVFVECSGRHVNGSPLSVKVADPSKCQLLGRAPSLLHVGKSEEVTVKTRGAGEGKLVAFVKHLDDAHPALNSEVEDLGLDTYTLHLTGKEIGRTAIDLQWGGFTIPNSPFLVNVCDASMCKADGAVLTSKRGKAGTAITFTVETADAGEGELEIVAKGPSAQYNISIAETKDDTYEASFTPWEVGEHKIEVCWGKENIPNSPFTVIVGSPLEMEVCNATGDGLKHGIAGQKTVFTIICSEMGLLDKNVLSVTVKGVTSHAKVVITDNNNGCYTVEYVPPKPGAYVASILFRNRQIPGSPFKVTVDSGPDASKCKAYGPALHPNTLAIAGSPLEFFVDTSEAGFGQLRVYIQGPNDYKPKVFMADDEKGVHSVKFDAMKPGKYFVVVCWSEKHIPNSPFRIKVHPAANAGRVKASGPGLLDSFIGTPGQFTIETRNAGIGTLLIRIHGLKDSFKIEAKPISAEDFRTLIVTYNPKLIGEYAIFVRWSGVHVPGSPFTVNIKQKPGE